MKKIRIGSRGSRLALAQTEQVSHALKKHHPQLEIESKTYQTKGDKILDVPLSQVGGKSFFTKELEDALLRKEIDVAVHSAKDLPTELPQGLVLGSVPKREEAADLFVPARPVSLQDLPNKEVGGLMRVLDSVTSLFKLDRFSDKISQSK